MNVLYIFGNGFDKAQGMATGYPEFYEHLQNNIAYGSTLLNRMKKGITEKLELWSDMEQCLGLFTAESDNADEFYDFYFELNDLLQKYLTSENDKFLPTDKLKAKFPSDFTTISKYLGALDKNRCNTFIKANGFSSSKDISVITLNYTNTLEKILSLNATTTKNFGSNVILRDIIHVHGQ